MAWSSDPFLLGTVTPFPFLHYLYTISFQPTSTHDICKCKCHVFVNIHSYFGMPSVLGPQVGHILKSMDSG